MRKKVLKLKNRKFIGYLEFFIVYLLMYGIMLNRHYSVDSYCYSNHYTTQYMGNLSLGRIGNYFVFGLFKNINIIIYQRYFTLLLIIVLAVSARMLYDHFEINVKNEKSLLILKIGVLIMYGNVFMVDYFNYIEMVLSWCCGIMFMTFAVLQIKNEMSVVNVALMLLFAMISLSFYQAMVGFFVYFGLIDIYMINSGKLTLKAFRDSIKVVLCGGAVGIINILILKVLQKTGIASATDRTESMGITGLIQNARGIFAEALKMLADKRGFLPSYLLLVALFILYVIIVITLIQKRAQWQDYIYIILVLVCCRGVLYLPHFLASTVWMAPRSIISYWSILSMPCLIVATVIENSKMRDIANMTMIILFVVSIINIQKICLNIIVTNRIDEEIAYMFQRKIEEYEETSGQEIQKIIFKNDVSPTWTYRTVEFQAFELCERSYVVPWACVECINFYNDENYIYELMDEETYIRYFKKDNWDELDFQEQLVFDENVAYYVAY